MSVFMHPNKISAVFREEFGTYNVEFDGIRVVDGSLCLPKNLAKKLRDDLNRLLPVSPESKQQYPKGLNRCRDCAKRPTCQIVRSCRDKNCMRCHLLHACDTMDCRHFVPKDAECGDCATLRSALAQCRDVLQSLIAPGISKVAQDAYLRACGLVGFKEGPDRDDP